MDAVLCHWYVTPAERVEGKKIVFVWVKCPWLIYGGAAVDCDSHSLNCSSLRRSPVLPLLPTERDNSAPRTITKSGIALFECASSQRMGDIRIFPRIFLSQKFAPAAPKRAESQETN